jgi:hypothetical protein
MQPGGKQEGGHKKEQDTCFREIMRLQKSYPEFFFWKKVETPASVFLESLSYSHSFHSPQIITGKIQAFKG